MKQARIPLFAIALILSLLVIPTTSFKTEVVEKNNFISDQKSKAIITETKKLKKSNFYLERSSPVDSQVLHDNKLFISKWDTRLTSISSSSANQIELPLEASGSYNFTIDWGDGNSDVINRWDQFEIKHTYDTEGKYTLTINGLIKGWRFNNFGDKNKIIEISQWGPLQLGNSESYFAGSTNLQLTAIDPLNLSGTTTLKFAFANCYNLGSNGTMDNWDVSKITDMEGLFWNSRSFNQPIGNWNVSSVTNMRQMFDGANAFNQSLKEWDVSSVTSMFSMFEGAFFFNQPLGGWNVSKVTNMVSMFESAYLFNQSIEKWDTSNVIGMSYMFADTYDFNQPIGTWNVSSVIFMVGMFANSWNFNQPISDWEVSNVADMSAMFYNAVSFDQPINVWNVSSVLTMEDMFYNVTLSTSIYDEMLVNWSELSLRLEVIFNAGNSRYSQIAIEARQFMIDTYDWIIIDGGLTSRDTANSDVNKSKNEISSSERTALFSIGDYLSYFYQIITTMLILVVIPKMLRKEDNV